MAGPMDEIRAYMGLLGLDPERRLSDGDLDNIQAGALGIISGHGGPFVHPADTLKLILEVRRLRAALAQPGGGYTGQIATADGTLIFEDGRLAEVVR